MISLPQIIAERTKALQREMKYRPLSELKENIRETKIRADFKKAIMDENDVSVICEYKPASPSMGKISDLMVEDVVSLYEQAGASAISVLTEEAFFKSDIKNLRIASKITKLPLLRKDFITSEYQIYEARSCGASAVLLMADLYQDLRFGIDLCHYLEMDAFVECKNRDEIKVAENAGAKIIGINNRNFHDFSIDFKRTEKLAKYVHDDVVLVSESGVQNWKDIKILGNYGADAVLVGSSMMRSTNISKKAKELVNAGHNIKVNQNEG